MFIQKFSEFVYAANQWLWGPVTILLLVGTGLYLTIRLRSVQLRRMGHSIKCISGRFDDLKEQGDISHFQALCAALSATIGTGNIAGVATAIAIGGPGAVFWMWVTALVGMATKFTSCSLALKYRVIHADGSASGGPMYYLEKGLKLKWLGIIFALCAGLASFGIGCAVQANSVTAGLLTLVPESLKEHSFAQNIPFIGGTITLKLIIGTILAFMVGIVIIGGIKRIARVASKIVPLMCTLYITSAIIILIINRNAVPQAFVHIFTYAFKPLAVSGGLFGAVLGRTIRMGVARGVFSNESGLGSAPIAHAAAKTHEPIREGFVAMLGPFIDTIIICTMSALVIITSGLWQVKSEEGKLLYGPNADGVPVKVQIDNRHVRVVGSCDKQAKPFLRKDGSHYEIPTGAALTASAFDAAIPRFGRWIVTISLVFFAYSTIISWSYYGDRCFEYLLGPKVIMPYRYLFCVAVILGSLGGLDLIWTVADNLNALMAAPNLIALIALSPVTVRDTKDYIKRMKESRQL